LLTGGINPGEFVGTSAGNANTTLHPSALTPYAGGGTPHENCQPYLVLLPCLAVAGSFPPFG
jgi:microcystin-dependent protein